MTTDLVDTLVAAHFPGSARELRIGGLPIGEVIVACGTPAFVYDAAAIERRWTAMRAAFPSSVAIHYSIKANPCPALVRSFVERGAGLEIASSGELLLALAAGAAPERILFAGPGKTDAELELALKHDIGEIHVESFAEVDRLAVLAARLGTRARVAARINPGADAQGGAMRMGGKPAPFGVDEERLDEIVTRVARDPALELRGVHLFAGTQILDAGTLLTQYEKALAIARRAAAIAGRPLATVDFGGGLGIPYFAGDQPLDLDRLGSGVAALLSAIARDPAFASTRFVVEPGRFLVGEAGIYVTRVTDVKTSRGKMFAILDGGMNHHLAASGNLGQVLKRNFPIALIERLDEPRAERVDVVGPLCTPLDHLGRDVTLPAPAIGDLVGIFQSGAYARSASPLGFLSRPAPPEVVVEHGAVHLVRRRGTDDELIADPR